MLLRISLPVPVLSRTSFRFLSQSQSGMLQQPVERTGRGVAKVGGSWTAAVHDQSNRSNPAAALLVNSFSSTRATSSRANTPLMLHHEWIIDGKVQVGSSSSSPSSQQQDGNVIVFLHGLLGNNKNLRTPAKLLSKKTGVSALMIDLRGHGESASSSSSSLSLDQQDQLMHPIQNCASDVIHTLQQLNLTGTASPKHICGHSFGGRCALAYHHMLLTNTYTDANTNEMAHQLVNPPKHCWILDSCPGNAHSSVAKVIDAVSSIQMPIQSKQELVQILTREKNIDLAIASWMTTNLRPSTSTSTSTSGTRANANGFEFMFDLQVVHSILKDFPNQDMIGMLRECMHAPNHAHAHAHGNAAHAHSHTIHKVIASKNESWTPEIMQQLQVVQNNAHTSNANSTVNASANLNLITLDAGHWVHIDALDALMQHMMKEF